jgi:hypothetical protein
LFYLLTFIFYFEEPIKRSKLDPSAEIESLAQTSLGNEELLIVTTTRNDFEFELNSNASNTTSTTPTTHTAIISSNDDESNRPKTSSDSSSSSSSSDPKTPHQLLSQMMPSLDISKLPPNLDEFELCRILCKFMSEGIDISSIASTPLFSSLFITQREKLDHINTIDQCVDLIHKSKNIIVLTGFYCSFNLI